jgi:hypothetical protein
MPSELMYIRGKASWAHTLTPNPYGAYTISVHPNPEGLEKLRELQAQGLKNTMRKDEDGWFMTFRCPQSKEMRGRIITFPPPEVIMDDGKKSPLQGHIGNGSDVTVKLEVYSHNTPGGGKARAARFVGVMIHNLVPFVSKEEQHDEEALF